MEQNRGQLVKESEDESYLVSENNAIQKTREVISSSQIVYSDSGRSKANRSSSSPLACRSLGLQNRRITSANILVGMLILGVLIFFCFLVGQQWSSSSSKQLSKGNEQLQNKVNDTNVEIKSQAILFKGNEQQKNHEFQDNSVNTKKKIQTAIQKIYETLGKPTKGKDDVVAEKSFLKSSTVDKKQENLVPDNRKSKQQNKSITKYYFYEHCHNEQRLFHQFVVSSRRMYYRSNYGVYFQSCFPVHQSNLVYWERQRQIIEWARYSKIKGEKVLYDCPKCNNYLEMVFLSKFIGPEGQLVIFNSYKHSCLNATIRWQQLKNIKFVQRTKGLYQNYPIVISKNQDFFYSEVENKLFTNLPKQLIITIKKPSLLKYNLLEKAVRLNQISLSKIILTQANCEDKFQLKQMVLNPNLSQGSYRFVLKSFTPPFGLSLIEYPFTSNPWILDFQQKYQDYKKSLPSPSERKNMSNILDDLPMRVDQMKLASQAEKSAWQNEKQIILWVKNRTKPNSVIYYEYNPQSANLFVILSLGRLLPKGKILVHCSPSMGDKLNSEMNNFNLDNIVFVRQPSERQFGSELVVTSNLSTIKLVVERLKAQSQFLLAYFDQKDPQTKSNVYRFYVDCHMRKVGIFPSFYYGYQIFDHFFWYSSNPGGFYELQSKKDVIYAYWSQSSKEMSFNRKDGMLEIIKRNSPQVKIIIPEITPYFEVPEKPFHSAFKYLATSHKSDFMRIYFLYFYGGGYTDIKHFHFDMGPFFRKLEQSPPNIYAIGHKEALKQEINCEDVPGQPSCKEIRQRYKQFMGYTHFIFKKRSPLMKTLINNMYSLMDSNAEELKKNPGRPNVKDWKGRQFKINGQYIKSSYPIDYLAVFPYPFIRAQYADLGHWYLDLPDSIRRDYE